MMHVSDKFINFLASWEGERLKAYQVQGESFWTIGVGHTGLVRGKKITKTTTITKAESRALLRQDLDRFEKAVRKNIPWRWRRRRRVFETCVSLAFNMGEEILTPAAPLESFAKVLQRQVTDRNITEACRAIRLYNKGGSPLRVMEGLVRRRDAEARLFKRGIYDHND
jgi:lysozyme